MSSLSAKIILAALLIVPAQFSMAEEGEKTRSFFGVAPKNPDVPEKPVYNEALTSDLVYRVAFSRADDIQILLDHGANPDSRNGIGIPVLSIAATRKDAEAPKIVKKLLKAGATVNIVGPDGHLPVTEAVTKGRADVLQVLIDYKTLLTGVKDKNGKELLAIAERRGDLQVLDVLNAGLEGERDRITSLKSKDNFINMVQEYAFLNCANEYINYYIASEPEKLDIVKFDRVVNRNNNEITEVGSNIKFIFKMKDSELRGIRDVARGEITDQLDGLLTNRNREINGVGTDPDLNRRCWKIAKKWNANKLNNSQYNQNLR